MPVQTWYGTGRPGTVLYMDFPKEKIGTPRCDITSLPRPPPPTPTCRQQGTEEALRGVQGDALGRPKAMVPPVVADQPVENLYSCVRHMF